MKLARLLAVLALPLLLAACSDSGPSTADEALVNGVWRVDRYVTELPNGNINDATSSFNGYRYTFFDDGYVVSEGRTGRVRGTWGAAEVDGRPALGIAIPGTPMFFGNRFIWWVEDVDDSLVALMVEDPHISVTRLVLVRI